MNQFGPVRLVFWALGFKSMSSLPLHITFRNMIKSLVFSICIIFIGASCSSPQNTTPSSISISDPNLIMELVASSPDIQTPIGMAIDQNDDLYVVESHTHTPAKDYAGPKYDRIKKGVDQDGDGIPENWIIYADSLEDAMNLTFGPDMELFVTTKDAVWSFQDLNQDGISDRRQLLLDMVAPDSPYDHAAILGVAVSPDRQWLFISRGNTGSAYWEIVGTDGSSITGYGDGGNVMRCRLDGSALEEVATGFWNPFDIKFTTDGRLMLTDNDPDSRGPNRLIEIVPGGDYGYKSLYGGSGLHPFVAWNAELVGTLPYAAPLGEAPCALIDAAFTGFGQDYQNNLLVNVWEEKNIVKIPMEEKGSSVQGVPQVLIQGDTTFHPVALVANSQGDLYVTNWVLRQYPNHGEGEIWRIRPKSRSNVVSTTGVNNYRFDETPMSLDDIMEQLKSDDPFLQSIARWKLARDADYQQLLTLLDHQNAEVQLQGLLVLQKHPQLVEVQTLSNLLGHHDLRLRQAALFYIGTRQVEEAMPTLTAALKSGSITPELFDSFLAAVQNLQPEFVQGYQQKKENKSNSLKRVLPENFIAEIIADRQTDEPIRALALPYLDKPQEHQELLLNQLRISKDEAYQVALIDAFSAMPNRTDIQLLNSLLLNILMNEDDPVRVRSMAAAAMVQPNADQCTDMLQLLTSTDVDLQYAIVNKLCACGMSR